MKKALYARHGLPYLWLLDPGDESLEAYELGADAYVLAGRRADAALASLPLFTDRLRARRSLAVAGRVAGDHGISRGCPR